MWSIMLRGRPWWPAMRKLRRHCYLLLAGAVRRFRRALHCSHENVSWLTGTVCTRWQCKHLTLVDVSCASVSGAPDDLLRLFNLLRSLALPTPGPKAKPGNVAKASITKMAFNAGLLTLITMATPVPPAMPATASHKRPFLERGLAIYESFPANVVHHAPRPGRGARQSVRYDRVLERSLASFLQ